MGAASGVGRGGRCVMVDRRRTAGASLYVAGEPVEKIWFVKRGSVLLSRDADEAGGEGVAWAVRRAGSLLGVEGLVRGTYLDSARALTDVIVCIASRDEVAAWIRGHDPATLRQAEGASPSSPAGAVLECVLVALSGDSPRRAGADGSARQRVAAWLLDRPGGQGPGMPRHVLAGLLGMLPETLSRALASLAAQGAVEVTRKRVEIRDAAALEAAAAHRDRGRPRAGKRSLS